MHLAGSTLLVGARGKLASRERNNADRYIRRLMQATATGSGVESTQMA